MGFEIENGVLKKYIEEEIDAEVVIPYGVTSIAKQAFSNSKIRSIVIPESVESIGDMAFYSCMSLKSAVISDNVKSIGHGAFKHCYFLESVNIPKSIKVIEYNTFWGCHYLKSIVIPDGVESIGNSAFFSCGCLASLTISTDVSEIGIDVFKGCDNLKNITIKGRKSTVKIYNNKFTKAEKTNIVDFVTANSDEREQIFSNMSRLVCKLPLAVFLACEHDNETAKKYIKKNITKTIKMCVDNDDAENLTSILSLDYVTKENIDKLISYAIDSRKPEIQIILSNYKNDSIGFGNTFDKFML
ncbi:MAG: leucine-rich repeat domain-containing protein [Ruminococcus sp.]|nr:leucine-rich repeat domain-containing protein [Ruminococcus sp.]